MKLHTDVQRPAVWLGTTADMRTRERNIPVVIKFVNPVFDFNLSSLLISGGHFVRQIHISSYEVSVLSFIRFSLAKC